MAKQYALKVDANHPEIREAARAAGYFWLDTFRQGDGCPDGFCLSKAGRWVAIEVKTPAGDLTQAEAEFIARLPDGTPYHIVRTGQELVDTMAKYD